MQDVYSEGLHILQNSSVNLLRHSEKSVARKSKIVLLDPTVFAKREKKEHKITRIPYHPVS